MFVYYYLHIERPFETVEPGLLRMLPGLRGWAEQAYRDGEGLRARIGPGSGKVAKTVEVVVGEPLRGASETWIPLHWEATGAPALFPKLDADLVASAVGDITQITFRGSYTVPLGPVGRTIDRLLLHRVAEASIKAFVERIARAVDDGMTDPVDVGRR